MYQPSKIVLYQKNPGKLAREEQLVQEYAQLHGVSVIYGSEKMMMRGRIDVDEDTFVSGSVGFVLSALQRINVRLPEHNPYPFALVPWLYRKVGYYPHLHYALDRLDKDGQAIFIKPAEGWKRFTGFVARSSSDYPLLGVSRNLPVWVSDPVTFVSEWRAYVLYGEIKKIALCDHGGDSKILPDQSQIEEAVSQLVLSGDAPAGFGIDFGVLADGRTALIEMNDGFSLGAYDGVDAETYTNILMARWFELIAK